MTRTEENLLRVMADQAHIYAGLHCEADYRAVGAALAEIDRLRAERDEAIAARESYVRAMRRFKDNVVADHVEARDDLAGAIGWDTPGIMIDEVAQMAVGHIEGLRKEVEALEANQGRLVNAWIHPAVDPRDRPRFSVWADMPSGADECSFPTKAEAVAYVRRIFGLGPEGG